MEEKGWLGVVEGGWGSEIIYLRVVFCLVEQLSLSLPPQTVLTAPIPSDSLVIVAIISSHPPSKEKRRTSASSALRSACSTCPFNRSICPSIPSTTSLNSLFLSS